MTEESQLPVFHAQARPLCVPLELEAMSATAQIRIIDRIGGCSGETITNVSDYCRTLSATIERQSQGYFTVEEAAQVLADTVPGVDAKEMIGQMVAANRAGGLPIRNPGDKLEPLDEQQIRTFFHLVSVDDVNEWLRGKGVKYGIEPTALTLETLALQISKVIAGRDTVTVHDKSDLMDRTILETLHKIGHLEQGVPGVRPHILAMVHAGEVKVFSTRGGLPPVEATNVTAENFDKWCISPADADTVRGALLGELAQTQAAPVHDAATPAPVVKETVEQRRFRYLEWLTAEEKVSKRGALQRVFEREQKQNPKADRANIGKDIKKARESQTESKRAGQWASHLVQDGKRQR